MLCGESVSTVRPENVGTRRAMGDEWAEVKWRCWSGKLERCNGQVQLMKWMKREVTSSRKGDKVNS